MLYIKGEPMNTLEWTTLFLGLVVRLAVPVGLTGFVVWFLRRLDARWQAEALQQATNVGGLTIPLAQLNCWDVHDCSPERKATCPAFLNSNVPCWEAHRLNGQNEEACQGCAFRKAKLAVPPAVSAL